MELLTGNAWRRIVDRKLYPSDVSDEEWAFVAPYLTLLASDAPQRTYPLRGLCNGRRWPCVPGAPWALPPWPIS